MSGGTMSVLLGFTTGVLSLVGLMSIFISMNSQHNVQRSREILWSLAALPYKKDLIQEKDGIGKEVFRKYLLYEQIINEKQDFSRIIINFAQIALGFCGLVWVAIVFNAFTSRLPLVEKGFLACGLLITVSFVLYFVFKILRDLKSTSKVGRLPTVLEILDADRLNVGLSIITLAAISSRLRIIHSNVYLGFPLPFKHLMATLSILNAEEKEELNKKTEEKFDFGKHIEQFKRLDPNEFKLFDDDYCWYPIYTFEADRKLRNEFFAQVEVVSRQGYVTAEFYVEDLKRADDAKLSIFPYSFAERFINRTSVLDPFSIYSERSPSHPYDEEPEWLNTGKYLSTYFKNRTAEKKR